MDTRVQFRIDESVKSLAMLAAARRKTTITDACRQVVEELAAEQRELESHDNWLKCQVDAAFEKLDSGEAKFMSNDNAKTALEKRKAAIRLSGNHE